MKNVESGVDPRAVAERAYALYLARGGEHGHDLEDWVRAEQELLGATRPKKPTTPRASTNGRGKR